MDKRLLKYLRAFEGSDKASIQIELQALRISVANLRQSNVQNENQAFANSLNLQALNKSLKRFQCWPKSSFQLHSKKRKKRSHEYNQARVLFH